MSGLRKCKKCQQVQALDSFPKAKGCKDGRRPVCDACLSTPRLCLTCGDDVREVRGRMHVGLAKYCSDACKPRCPAPECASPIRENGHCQKHSAHLKRHGSFDVAPHHVWSTGWVCLVCGKSVEKGSGRRKHCSNACQQADARHEGKRPTAATCSLCKCEYSLIEGENGRLRRTDVKFCRACWGPDRARYMRYGITPDAYRDAVAKGCEICGRTDRKLHIDHDHNCCPPNANGTRRETCGKCVRGFLCGPCNRGIGLLDENVTALGRAIAYLSGGE